MTFDDAALVDSYHATILFFFLWLVEGVLVEQCTLRSTRPTVYTTTLVPQRNSGGRVYSFAPPTRRQSSGYPN